jgi:hypothetical protein
MHVLLDPRMLFAMGLILTPRDRNVLDEQPVEAWADHVEPLYNDPSFCPEAQPLLFDGVGRGYVDGIDPSKLLHERTSDMLKAKFSELRSAYARSLANFQISGQNEADSFPHFANGDMVVIYLHYLLQTGEGSRLRDFASRRMPEDAQREEGTENANVESGARGNTAADRRRAASRIRKRHLSPSGAAEVTVRGLEGLVPMDPDAARRGEVSESLASGAKATREIIASVAAIKAAMKEQDEDDSYYEVTMFALKKRKKELITQLKGSDGHNN